MRQDQRVMLGHDTALPVDQPDATRAAPYLSTVGLLGQPCFCCQAFTAATGDFCPFLRQESRYGQG